MMGNYKTGEYYLIFSYGVIGVLFYLLSVYTPLMADDFSFAYVYDRNGANILSPIMNLSDIIISQYNHYFVSNGRTPVQFIEQLFAGLLGRGLFNLFNTLIFLLFLWISASFIGQKKNRLYIVSALFLLFWFLLPVPGETLLWMSGSVCYLWASCFVLLFLHFFFKINTMSIPKWGYPFLFFAGVLSGWVHEGLTVGVSCCLFLYICFHRKKFRGNIVPLTLGFWGGTLLVFSSPGIWMRGISSFDLISFVMLCVRFALYIKAFWILMFILLYLYIRKRGLFKEFLKKNAILLGIAFFEFIFGCLIGLQSIRQTFFVELFSIILIAKYLVDYVELFYKYKMYFLLAVLCLFIPNYICSLNACMRNYELYQSVFEEYRNSKDGVIPTDYKRNSTWFSTHAMNRFVHPYFFTHNAYYYLNCYLPYYIRKDRLIVLPRVAYEQLYLDGSFCRPENRISSIEGDFYTIPSIDFYVMPLSKKDSKDYESMNVSYKFNMDSINIPWYIKPIRSYIKRLNPNGSLSNGSAITKLKDRSGNYYLLIDKPYATDLGVRVVEIEFVPNK
ncbi:MAG TPA: DUF6056 family protein [Parabacteroides johnsonii]|mgnify:FL=1|uniref:DUF6056 family protein n=2 Tax=Parabacteroides johnsonii TaxID=387661 RepID=UPI00101BE90C|nr:DUF6056 family protein [Parabacteroides johnsonii]HJG99050.1 DUF6056 family protein [Parabacteroides johnsonii]